MLNNFMAEKYKVKIHQAKVGEINVGKKMLEISSPIGGEGNGGIICPEINYTRDALAGIVFNFGFAFRNRCILIRIS